MKLAYEPIGIKLTTTDKRRIYGLIARFHPFILVSVTIGLYRHGLWPKDFFFCIMDLLQVDRERSVILSLSLGGIIAITYPIMITYHANDVWSLLMEVIFGPFFIITYLGLFLFIRHHGHSIYNVFGLIFNVLACFSVTLMFNVQKSIFSIGGEYRELTNELSREMVQRSFQIGNLTQLGMDFCFDIFISFSTFFLGLALLYQPMLYKWFGYLGMIIGLGCLTLNILTFPIPPADLTYPDPGPFYSIFFTLVLLNLFVVILKSRRNGIKWI